jgi:glycosyltransferase involved in cell wall biosynthesis
MLAAPPLRIAYVYRHFQRIGSIPNRFVRNAELLAGSASVTAVCAASTREATRAPITFQTVEPIVRGHGRVAYALECGTFAVRATQALSRVAASFDVVHVEGHAALAADLVTVHAVRAAEVEHYFERVEPDAGVRRWLHPYARPQARVVMSIERRLFGGPRPPFCLCISETVRSDLERVHGVPRELTEILPYGVSLERFRHDPAARASKRAKLAVPEDRLLCLFVGDDFARKGLACAIEGLARSRTPAELVVVGSDHTDAYRELATSLRIAHRVRFIGRVPNEDLPECYAAADVVLLPSRQDAWGISVIEGLAAGRVVVTSEFTGASSAIQNGVDGFVLERAGEPAALAALLDGELGDRARRKAVMARAGEAARPYGDAILQQRWLAAHERAFHLRQERAGSTPASRSAANLSRRLRRGGPTVSPERTKTPPKRGFRS